MITPVLTGIDIGSPQLPGTQQQSGRDLEIVAAGVDIWGARDEFHFSHDWVSGNFELSIRVVALTMADVYTKAGLMFRTSLDAGSEHALFLTFGDNQSRNHNNGGLEFQYRTKVNGPCTGIYPPQPLPATPDFPVNFPDVWLKLIRHGNVFTGQFSGDGAIWKTYCMYTQSFPSASYVGVAVTSHHPKRTVKGVFRELKFKGFPEPILKNNSIT